MYDQTRKEFSARDVSGSYAWIVENLEPKEVAMSDQEIHEWAETIVEQSMSTDAMEIDEKVESLSFPRYGYTANQVFQNSDEWKAFKRKEIKEDYVGETEEVYRFLKHWLNFDGLREE